MRYLPYITEYEYLTRKSVFGFRTTVDIYYKAAFYNIRKEISVLAMNYAEVCSLLVFFCSRIATSPIWCRGACNDHDTFEGPLMVGPETKNRLKSTY